MYNPKSVQPCCLLRFPICALKPDLIAATERRDYYSISYAIVEREKRARTYGTAVAGNEVETILTTRELSVRTLASLAHDVVHAVAMSDHALAVNLTRLTCIFAARSPAACSGIYHE
jgi:hypothetical protein